MQCNFWDKDEKQCLNGCSKYNNNQCCLHCSYKNECKDDYSICNTALDIQLAKLEARQYRKTRKNLK